MTFDELIARDSARHARLKAHQNKWYRRLIRWFRETAEEYVGNAWR